MGLEGGIQVAYATASVFYHHYFFMLRDCIVIYARMLNPVWLLYFGYTALATESTGRQAKRRLSKVKWARKLQDFPLHQGSRETPGEQSRPRCRRSPLRRHRLHRHLRLLLLSRGYRPPPARLTPTALRVSAGHLGRYCLGRV